MKVSYMLLNKSGKARKIPPGHAWQWTYHVEDATQLTHVFVRLKREIRDNRLVLANLRIERHKLEVDCPQDVRFDYKGTIIYDGAIQPQRIINKNAVDVDASFNGATVEPHSATKNLLSQPGKCRSSTGDNHASSET